MKITMFRYLFYGLLIEGLFTIWLPSAGGVAVYEILIFALFGMLLWMTPAGALGVRAAAVFLPALWGLIQVSLGTTVKGSATVSEIVQWLAVGCTFLVASAFAQTPRDCKRLLYAIGLVSGLIVVASLVQAFTSSGLIFWCLPTGEQRAFGPFNSQNNFASFIVLMLPVCLWHSYGEGRFHLNWSLLSATMVAGAVASSSRAGAALVAAELAVFSFRFVRLDRRRSDYLGLLTLVLLIIGSVCAVGWQTLGDKFTASNPLRHRSEIARATLRMVANRPIVGYGLGSFTAVYPSVAEADSGFFVNFAHNDWLEFASEGGLPYMSCILAALVAAVTRLRHGIWGIGLLGLFFHALVDYPFQRLGLSVWIVTIAALLIRVASLDRKAIRGFPGGSLPVAPS